MGLLNRERTDIDGEILFEGTDLLKLKPDEIRKIRGRDVSMIFQDPLACLHPMYRVGDQIAEAVRAHQNISKKVASPAPSSCSARSGSRTPASARRTTRTSSRAACGSAP